MGIAAVAIDENGKLIATLTDGTELNAGVVLIENHRMLWLRLANRISDRQRFSISLWVIRRFACRADCPTNFPIYQAQSLVKKLRTAYS